MVNASARRRLYLAVVAFSAFVGILCAGFNSGIGPFPPNGSQVATATTHVMVDAGAISPSIAYQRAMPQDQQTAIQHAELLGRTLVSPPVLDRIAHRCHVSPTEVSGIAQTTANVPIELLQPNSERRASDIQASRAPYQLEVQARPTMPIIDVYTQAPSVGGAECLANESSVSLSGFLRNLANKQGVRQGDVSRVRQIGGAYATIVDARAPLEIAALTFLVAFIISCGALAGLIYLRQRRLARRGPGREQSQSQGNGASGGNGASPNGDRKPHGVLDGPGSAEDDGEPGAPADDCWPRTTRVLPWMLAGFIAVLWLVPFNTLLLNVPFPIDLSFDRLVLPLVAIAWVLAFVGRSSFAPRIRLTWIHAALGLFLLLALLSVVLDAPYLNQTLELPLALKKLPLLLSYMSLFLITASAVRRGEVRAFLTYTLVLAVICALGIIYEYRFKQNLFWSWAHLLPGPFSVIGQPGGIDSIGRLQVQGPTEAPLEAVAMLTMALPISLARLMDAKEWRGRVLYGLAACLLMAAVLATNRKSAIVAPAAVLLMLAYFRRRELLRLAPLAVVFVIVVVALSPGALKSTVDQFTRSDAQAVGTVSDRTADYDAIRPDVWSHLAFGRGYGSYNHDTYRILDSEILLRTIEGGVFGLISFLLIGVSVIVSTRRSIRSRDPTSAQPALIGAATAVAFIVLAFLFDELSFPHVPYIFLYMVGLAAVVVAPRWSPKARRTTPSPAVVPLERRELVGPLGAQDPLVPARRENREEKSVASPDTVDPWVLAIWFRSPGAQDPRAPAP